MSDKPTIREIVKTGLLKENRRFLESALVRAVMSYNQRFEVGIRKQCKKSRENPVLLFLLDSGHQWRLIKCNYTIMNCVGI